MFSFGPRKSGDMIAFAYKILDQEHPSKEEVSIWNPDYQNLGAYVLTVEKLNLKAWRMRILLCVICTMALVFLLRSRCLGTRKSRFSSGNYIWDSGGVKSENYPLFLQEL